MSENRSVHKEIRLPAFIDPSDILAEKRYVVRPNGSSHERHLCFVRSLAAFYVIASQAGAHKVLPRVLATAALRHDVIDCQRHTRQPTVLALVSIAAKNILARENHLFERHPHEY